VLFSAGVAVRFGPPLRWSDDGGANARS